MTYPFDLTLMASNQNLTQPNNVNLGSRETNISDVWSNLGILHEVVGAFSRQECLDSFWSCVCKNSHWIIPTQRMGVILKVDESLCELVGRLEEGQELPLSERLQAKDSEMMQTILEIDEDVRWLSLDWLNKAKEDNPLCGWVVGNRPGEILTVPLQSNNQRVGCIVFVLTEEQITDRTIMSTMAVGYALYVSITYTLLQTTEKLLATNKNLETEIEERKRVEQALQVYQEKLQDLVADRTAELTQANKQLRQEIIERELIEDALALARDQAVQASQLKSQLLSRVSHELRTPLNIIGGHVDLLDMEMYGDVSEEQKEIFAIITESCNTLTRIVNELLDQASLDAGRLTLNITEFSPSDLLNTVHNKLQILAQAKGIALSVQIDQAVPGLVAGDLERTQQILVNLISNAIKFTSEGSVNVLFFLPYDNHWAMQVSDTGLGIPLAAQERIFWPFQQVDGSMTRLHGGNGLGLSIVKELTTLMDGIISLESTVGQGSTFTIYLPLRPFQENKSPIDEEEMP